MIQKYIFPTSSPRRRGNLCNKKIDTAQLLTGNGVGGVVDHIVNRLDLVAAALEAETGADTEDVVARKVGDVIKHDDGGEAYFLSAPLKNSLLHLAADHGRGLVGGGGGGTHLGDVECEIELDAEGRGRVVGEDAQVQLDAARGAAADDEVPEGVCKVAGGRLHPLGDAGEGGDAVGED